jgi:phosphoglycerate kinase
VKLKTISELTEKDLAQKKVFIRVDFNVPHNKKNQIIEDAKIQAALPTINYLIEKKAKVIICSHRGRPKGQVVENLRLNAVGKKLASLLGNSILKSNDCIGPDVQAKIAKLQAGQILLLENIRFHPGEASNDPQFSQELASLADLYINNAFGCAHRAHASTVGITKYLPSYAGFLLEKEVLFLNEHVKHPKRPFVAIVGGAKASTKIGVMKNLLNTVDSLIIAGGMVFTFLKVQGYEIGKSLCEHDKINEAQDFLKLAQKSKSKLYFPVDQIVVDSIEAPATKELVDIKELPSNKLGVDIGPRTIKLFSEIIKDAATIMWNGPVGIFETDEYAQGTIEIAKVLAKSKAITIVGGGDSGAAISKAGLTDKITHISTGGGAAIEFLEGCTLPGVEVLISKE